MATGQTRDSFIRSSAVPVCALDNIEVNFSALLIMVCAVI